MFKFKVIFLFQPYMSTYGLQPGVFNSAPSTSTPLSNRQPLTERMQNNLSPISFRRPVNSAYSTPNCHNAANHDSGFVSGTENHSFTSLHFPSSDFLSPIQLQDRPSGTLPLNQQQHAGTYTSIPYQPQKQPSDTLSSSQSRRQPLGTLPSIHPLGQPSSVLPPDQSQQQPAGTRVLPQSQLLEQPSGTLPTDQSREQPSDCLHATESEQPLAKNKLRRKRRRIAKLSEVASRILSSWYERHLEHPYPDHVALQVLSETGGVTVEQVQKWFSNRRMRDKNTKSLTEIAARRKRIITDDDASKAAKRLCV